MEILLAGVALCICGFLWLARLLRNRGNEYAEGAEITEDELARMLERELLSNCALEGSEPELRVVRI